MTGVQYGVVAGNCVDMGAGDNRQSDARGVVVAGTTSGTIGLSIVGNSFRNIFSAAIYSSPVAGSYEGGINIIGNTFENCGINSTSAQIYACMLSHPLVTNVIISGNSFIDCPHALTVQGRGNTITSNMYSGSTYPNYIVDGNIVNDQDSTADTPDCADIRASQSIYSSYVLGSPTIIVVTNATAPWTATSLVSPFVVLNSPYETGGQMAAFSLGIGAPGAAISGCTLEVIVVAGGEIFDPNTTVGGTDLIYTSDPFTIPETIGSITDVESNPSIVISCPAPVSYYKYEFKIIVPGSVSLDVRYATVTTLNAACGSVVAGVDTIFDSGNAQFDFEFSASAQTPSPFLVTGDFGNNKGQMALGPLGSPLSQIAMYNVTGTYPSVAANSETVIGPVTVTSATGAIPQTTDQIFVSSSGAFPTGLFVAGVYCNSTGELTFKVLNVTTTPYSNADPYNLWFQGVSQ